MSQLWLPSRKFQYSERVPAGIGMGDCCCTTPSPSPSPSPHSTTPGTCGNCTTIPARWTFSTSGYHSTTGNCDDSSSCGPDGTFVLSYQGSCAWISPNVCPPSVAFWRLSYNQFGDFRWILTWLTTLMAFDKAGALVTNCLIPLTLNRVPGSSCLIPAGSSAPTTITLTPS
jgi:hypothetical protein